MFGDILSDCDVRVQVHVFSPLLMYFETFAKVFFFTFLW